MKALLIGAFILAGFGAWITSFNVYLSWVRYPLHQKLHADKPYKWISGLPMVGSLFMWLGSALLWWLGQKQWAIAGLVVSLLDTGGLHWFFIALVSDACKGKV